MGYAFNKALPTALALGMTPDQYWWGDCWLFAAYREARRLENERQEWIRWEMGMYVYDALIKTHSLFDPFAKKRKADPWNTEPYGVKVRRSPVEQARHEEKLAHEKMKTWVLNHKAKH